VISQVTFDASALVASLALLLTAFFTGLANLQRKRNEFGQEDAQRLGWYERWRPKVRIVIAELRDLLAKNGIAEPPGIDEDLEFPPKDKKVKADE
jgi:hypothetical protein